MRKLLQEAHTKLQPEVTVEEWITSMEKSPTFVFWMSLLKFQEIFFIFIRAQRCGNFSLYVESLQALAPYFFALDHYNYARWLPIHIQDLLELDEHTLEAFQSGNFVVKRSKKRFSALAVDQAHEQLNKIIKGTGGIIGLTQDTVSLVKWSLCGPILSELIEDFKQSIWDENTDVFHHDEGKKRQLSFAADVRNLIDVIRSKGNPFLDRTEDLVNLDGVISEDSQSVFELEKVGQKQYSEFVKKVIVERTVPVDNAIKKNNILIFKIKAHRKPQPKKFQLFKSNASLFCRMYIASDKRGGDLKTFFAHEAHCFPPSMAYSEDKMYHPNKSAIVQCILNEGSDDEHCSTSLHGYDAVIHDGGSLIHSLIPRGNHNFQTYGECQLLKLIHTELRKTSRVDVVWDCYREHSIKEEIRSDRGKGSRLKVSARVQIPKNWCEFLQDSKNKTELFSFLTEIVLKGVSGLGNVYITGVESNTVRHVGPGDEMVGEFKQEEADTRIVVHILHALNSSCSSIIVKTSDSDIVVILIGHYGQFHEISEDCQIHVLYGTGKNKRILSIGSMSNALGPARSIALPLFVALTGCDTTSGFKGRSKGICFKAWKRSPPELTDVFCDLLKQPFQTFSEDSSIFKALENFFVNIYGGKSGPINELRRTIFCEKSKNVEFMPPTQNALFQHCLRAVFQGSVWATAHDPEIEEPDPCLYGWKKTSDGAYKPVWMTVPEVSHVCQELIKCSCRKSCSLMCTCVKNNLTCTDLCKCTCYVEK